MKLFADGARVASGKSLKKPIQLLDVRWDEEAGAITHVTGKDLAVALPALPEKTASVAARVQPSARRRLTLTP